MKKGPMMKIEGEVKLSPFEEWEEEVKVWMDGMFKNHEKRYMKENIDGDSTSIFLRIYM